MRVHGPHQEHKTLWNCRRPLSNLPNRSEYIKILPAILQGCNWNEARAVEEAYALVANVPTSATMLASVLYRLLASPMVYSHPSYAR